MVEANDYGKRLIEKYGLRGSHFEVNAGWHGILETLIQDLIALGWDREVAQVKEKFSACRFYIGNGSHAIHDRIDVFEDQSAKTCEFCGQPGSTVGKYWIKTLCTKCAEGYTS